MTGALDPLHVNTGQLHAGLTLPASASAAGNIATVQVSADGALEAIHLTDAARRLDPDSLVAMIIRLHATALSESRAAVAAAVAQLDSDPRLQAQRERYVDALQQALPVPPLPLPAQQPVPQDQQHQPMTPRPSASQPWHDQQPGWNPTATFPAASARREPTPEDDEADDAYFQRSSWLE
ncbi:hypothetical protein NN3_42010 [Nocardia neocaledoniensis NBRC 108232]|uniref:hypothetical protein n=1 Tax=Nocardia neocaledoniensis TaxID=236511 RepID=UPI001195600E|nr:hypothetical protein [Nocardia neocaledoniensis]GEM33194.1 hypothetical protein NN3_42010 [Nocardia neocaledoniensis NBRC 108232]